MIELRLLGAIVLTGPGGQELRSVLTQPKRLALLAYLAVAAPRGFHRRDTLLALFWPEHDEAHARAALSRAVYHLRRALGEGVLVSRGGEELGLSTDRICCDVSACEDALESNRLENALALYRGDLLTGFHISDAPGFERWLDEEGTRLRRRAAAAAWSLAEARERSGDAVDAAEWGQRAVELSHADETMLRRLLGLLDRLGDRAAAVHAYEIFARRLEHEYELEPSEETRAFAESLRPPRESNADRTREARRHRPLVEVGAPHATDPAEGIRSGAEGSPFPAERYTGPDPIAEASPRSTAQVEGRWWTRRAAWLGSMTLLALLVIGAWHVMAVARREHAPRARERVVVADFANLTSDSTLGDLVAHVLRSELARSSVAIVMGEEAVASALRRMRREPDARLAADLAREVAVREEAKLVVEGDVRATGGGLVLTASVIEAATGDVIGGASEIARDSTEVLAAVERLAGDLRRGTGESIASARTGDSLLSLTTSSLAALRKHMAGSRAWWRGDYRAAVELFEEAVSLDPEFAHAHLMLGALLRGAGYPRDRVLRPIVRAYELRDRLTERERYAVEGQYFLNVEGDLPRAVAAFRKHVEALKQLPIGEAGWYASLADALQLNGDLAGARAVLEVARVRHPSAASLTTLIRVLYASGDESHADALLEEVSRRIPEHPAVVASRVGLLAAAGRYDDAHALVARAYRKVALPDGLQMEAELDALQGRTGEAIGHLRERQDQEVEAGEPASALEVAVAIGRLRLLAGDAAGATEVDRFLARHPVGSMDVLARPYLEVAELYANAGRPRRARAWLDAYEREEPSRFRGPDRWMLHRVRAATYGAEGNPMKALAELREVERAPALHASLFDDPFIPVSDRPELARVYDALGARDSAVAVYERYLAARSLNRVRSDAFELGPALERLAGLHAARGDSARAAAHFRRLAELWRGADAALRPRAEAARRRAAMLHDASEHAAITTPPARSSP